MQPRRAAGFTLIEVLVALAIAAIGLAAVLAVVTHSARNEIYFRDKTFASWIGQNRITEARLAATLPSVDQTKGELEYAGQNWKWEQTVTQTDVAGLRRVDVAVRFADAAPEQPIATVTGFVDRTQIAAPQSGASWELGAGASPGNGGQRPGPQPYTRPQP